MTVEVKLERVSRKLKDTILSDLNLDEKSLDEGVHVLQDWISKQPHLPAASDDKNMLKAFIIGAKSVERAKSKLDAYFSARTKYPSLFDGWIPHEMTTDKYLESVYLPGTTPKGWKVMFVKLSGNDPAVFYNQTEAVRKMVMMLEIQVRDEPHCAGHLIVSDMKNMSMGCLTRTSVIECSRSMYCWQDVFPIRFKGMVSFNAHPVVDMLVNTCFKPFLSKKLQERFYTYTDDSSLSKHVPVKMLPREYGGEAPSFEELHGWWDKKLKSETQFFQNLIKMKSDEAKRITDSQELQGTFRKLNID